MLTFNFKKYKLKNYGTMLDVGCGEGRHIFGVMQDYPMMKCIGLDMDKKSLQIAEEGYEYFDHQKISGGFYNFLDRLHFFVSFYFSTPS